MKDLFIYVVVPLIISNVLHIIMVKKNLLSFLVIPVSAPLFGQNKTWRGFVIVPFLNAAILLLINIFVPHFTNTQALIIGFILGAAYVLFELPNSYLKRRLGIAPGGTAENHRLLFMLTDKTDSSFGVSLASYFLLNLSVLQAVQLFIISVLTHIIFSWLLVVTRIKKSF